MSVKLPHHPVHCSAANRALPNVTRSRPGRRPVVPMCGRVWRMRYGLAAGTSRVFYSLPMDTPDLAALMPDLMADHPSCRWNLLSGRITGEDLLIEVHPLAWPDRVATVQVNAGAEVFHYAFAGHESTDFAYEDEGRPETLRERIDLAVRAVTGPTRVIRYLAGDALVGSVLTFGLHEPRGREDVVSWPLRRLKAFLTRGRI